MRSPKAARWKRAKKCWHQLSRGPLVRGADFSATWLLTSQEIEVFLSSGQFCLLPDVRCVRFQDLDKGSKRYRWRFLLPCGDQRDAYFVRLQAVESHALRPE